MALQALFQSCTSTFDGNVVCSNWSAYKKHLAHDSSSSGPHATQRPW